MIYVVGMGTLQSNFGLDSLWHMLGLVVISAAIYLFVKKNGLLEKYGLAGWAKNSRAMLWFIPLWILSCLNLFSGFLVSVTPYNVQTDEKTGVVEIRSLLWALRKNPPNVY